MKEDEKKLFYNSRRKEETVEWRSEGGLERERKKNERDRQTDKGGHGKVSR